MIIYGIFTVFMLMGFIFFVMGFYEEMQLFSVIGPMLGAPGFLPVSLGWFLMGFIIMFIALIGIFFRIKMTGVGLRFDKPPKGQSIFNFMYRDGSSMDLHGKRRPGLGIFDLPQLGVVVDVGRLPTPGSVYRFGGKPIRYALQDIGYTPNPKFTTIYSFLSALGFNNMEDVQDVFKGRNPELMVKVWNKLVEYEPQTPEDKIVDNIIDMTPSETAENTVMWKEEIPKKKRQVDREEIDLLLKERGKNDRKIE